MGHRKFDDIAKPFQVSEGPNATIAKTLTSSRHGLSTMKIVRISSRHALRESPLDTGYVAITYGINTFQQYNLGQTCTYIVSFDKKGFQRLKYHFSNFKLRDRRWISHPLPFGRLTHLLNDVCDLASSAPST